MNQGLADGARGTLAGHRMGRHVLLALALIASVAFIAVPGARSSAVAATEINWYLATPGYFRTDLQTTNIAMDPDGDRLFAVAGDGAERRLLLIDFDDYSVLSEVPIQDSDIWDLEVSSDGTVLFILDSAGVTLFDTKTLAELQFIAAAGGRDTLALAPGSNGIFALQLAGRVFRDGMEIDLAGTVLEGTSGFGFGVSSAELYAINSRGLPVKTSLVGTDVTLVLMREDTRYARASRSELDDGVLYVSDSNRIAELNPDTLELTALTSPRGYSFVFSPEDRRVYSFSGGQSWVRGLGLGGNDAVHYSFAPEAQVMPLLAIGDGVVLATESSYGEPGRLIEIDTDVLTSGYGDFHAVTPDRIVDTRSGIGVGTARRVGPGETITFDVGGQAGVPSSGVLAVTLNATVTEPTGSGFVKIWPTGVERPAVSNVNFAAGQTIANGVTVVLGPDGALQLYNHAGAAAHVLIDVTGYYANSTGERGARYLADSKRVLDTRNATQGRLGKLGQGEFIDLYVPSYGWENVEPIRGTVAAVLNVTVANATAPSFLSVYPRDAPSRPETSTINFYPGDLRSNLTIAAVSSGGWVRVYNHGGSVDVIVDVVGHYVAGSPYNDGIDQRGRYFPVLPFRSIDTRESSPFDGDGALTPGGILLVPGSSDWTYIVNLTVTEPTSDGYVSVIPWAGQPPFGPLKTSSVNFVRGQTVANGVYARSGSQWAVVNPLGNSHVVIDVFGYLTPAQLEPIDVVFSRMAALQGDPGDVDHSWDVRSALD